MNILGFNPLHHGSVCLLQDGELKYFIQEERIGNRKKYSPYPFQSFFNFLQKFKIDTIAWGSPSIYFNCSDLDFCPPIGKGEPYWVEIGGKYNPDLKWKDLSDQHHLCHVAHSFYNSGFEKCIGIVIDGMGSCFEGLDRFCRETESIFHCSYPNNFQPVYQNFTKIVEKINLCRVYETITMHLGWTRDEVGKSMGLAPYGKYNSQIPSLFIDQLGNPDVFFFDKLKKPLWNKDLIQETFIDEEKNPHLKLSKNPKEWHYDESKITDLEKDLAWKVQNDTQQLVGDYIEKAIKETGLQQVCCAGGYFLNCVTNYYLLKRFPDIEFYFEPISNDAGTAIGAAKLSWHTITQDTTVRPFKSLYLGKQYSKEELLEGIEKYIN